jgi:NAD(P)-dependent dehydrogenase (short-subunit alcohol dehydrogenase family)
MGRFSGKVAVITGAGSGIAQATARRFGSEDATVACLDIDEGAAEKTAAAIVEAGGSASAFHCNVADPESVTTAVAAVVSGLGAPNVLCNIAGVGGFANTTEVAFDEWQRVIAVNLTGTFLMCQATLPHILENGGNIVNTASNAGLQGLAYAAAYCASKGGVVQLTRALATAWAKDNIQVNAVLPGWIDTALTRRAREEVSGLHERVLARTPAGRWGAPEDLAGIAVFLCSSASDFVTGTAIPVDGGYAVQA